MTICLGNIFYMYVRGMKLVPFIILAIKNYYINLG